MKVHIEGYGCSMNRAETEMIKGLFRENKAEFTDEKNADLIVINTCAVKDRTESKMLGRIKKLNGISQSNKSKLVVVGCLPKVSPHLISEINPSIRQFGPDLKQLSKEAGFEEMEFRPGLPQVRDNSLVSIIPINLGCVYNCSYCGTKLARGNLESYPVAEIEKKFSASLENAKEIWLTSQDTGAYGLDISTNLAKLLKQLLDNNQGDYKVRVGMMTPSHFRRFCKELLEVMKDERVYKFLHLPVQSGSNEVLGKMKRPYKVSDFEFVVNEARKAFPEITISTDIIVGFPGETENDFNETISLIERTRPDVINVSRFSARPNTEAAEMKGQVPGNVLKERTRVCSRLCRRIEAEKNGLLVGKELKILVNEPGSKGNYAGRTPNYKTVVIRENLLGNFVDVKAVKAFPTYVEGEVLSKAANAKPRE